MHNHGLIHDLAMMSQQAADRRRALRWLGATLALPMVGCGGGTDDDSTIPPSSGSSSSGTGMATGNCSVIPTETAGPYPGDGSNSSNNGVANALALSGIVRQDIRTSVAGATGVAPGVRLTMKIVLVNASNSCASLEGYAIYLWHCDALGRYSMYSPGVTGENYLRGVQPTDGTGTATFMTIYPGCYSGRMPHMHFEVYRSSTTATSYSNKLHTSQIAFPNLVSSAVYATSGYTNSASNLASISFATDNVFSDDVTLQLATITGNVIDGYVATLTVGISA